MVDDWSKWVPNFEALDKSFIWLKPPSNEISMINFGFVINSECPKGAYHVF